MTRPVIAVDIDDVLYPTAQYLADAIGTQHNLAFDAYRSGKLPLGAQISAQTGRTAEEAASMIRDAFLHESFYAMKPFEEARAALKELQPHYRILAVTARSTESHDGTRAAIKRDFDDLVEEVYFPNATVWTEPFVPVDKTGHLLEVGATWLIDDKLFHLQPLAGTNIKAGLFGDYPWNQHDDLPPDVIRLNNWDAVIATLLG